MATMQHKPVPHTVPAAKPVADARARALQEQIRALREQARQAGDRLLQAPARIRERLQAEWEQAEQACRQAEAQMARLRAEALGAAAATSQTVFDGQHPSSQLPEEVLQRLIQADTPPARPTPVALDQDLDRNQAANAALGLLQRASEPLLHNSPVLEQGLLQLSDTTMVKATGIDFGPLVEEPAEVPARPLSQPVPKPASTPRAPAAASKTVFAPQPVQPRPRLQPHARAVPATGPVVAPHSGRKSRSAFTTALLIGALLGGLIVLALIWFTPLSL